MIDFWLNNLKPRQSAKLRLFGCSIEPGAAGGEKQECYLCKMQRPAAIDWDFIITRFVEVAWLTGPPKQCQPEPKMHFEKSLLWASFEVEFMKVVFILIWPGPKIRGLRVSLDKPVWKNQVIFGQIIF